MQAVCPEGQSHILEWWYEVVSFKTTPILHCWNQYLELKLDTQQVCELLLSKMGTF